MPKVKGSYKVCSRILDDVLFVCKETDDIFGSWEYHYSLLLHNVSPYPALLNHVQKYGLHDLYQIPYPENPVEEVKKKKRVEKADKPQATCGLHKGD